MAEKISKFWAAGATKQMARMFRWTRMVPPGHTGLRPVRVETHGWSGEGLLHGIFPTNYTEYDGDTKIARLAVLAFVEYPDGKLERHDIGYGGMYSLKFLDRAEGR